MVNINAQEQIEKFKDLIEENYLKELHSIVKKGKKVLVIDFSDIRDFDHELAEQLLEEPEETLRAAELSLEQFDIPIKVPVRIRIRNLPESQKIFIRDIRSENINKFVVIEGIVRRATDVRPQVTSAKFECPSCANTISILQLDTKFKEPSLCGSCGRRGRFRLLGKDLVDAQHLVIEEIPELLEGEQPKRMSIFLKDDLVEPKMEKKTTPGNKIMVVGVIKEVPILLRSGAQSIRYDLMIEANYIEAIEEAYEEIEISKEDEEKILKLSKDPDLYKKLTNSIAPMVFGMDDIKEAILLQLFSGVKKVREDGSTTRADMHILLVGDPGSAKSTILASVVKIAPKARFVAGKAATAAGITATVMKDEFLRGWALEAGALVLANKGLLALDEMNLMGEEDRSAMHEAMELQVITISKANIQATLRAETTILAAANPKFGRFDPMERIANQIDLPPTLINRFDLIFPVRDIPNKERDEKIAKHVLKLHQKPEDIKPTIPKEIFRKYVAYAKQKVKPELTDAAVAEIENFYVSLRSQAAPEESVRPIPISARQLEALVRLAEASAKVRLGNKVTKQDAQKAISLLKYCLSQVGVDAETGLIDIDIISTGIPASERNKINIIKGLINDLEKKNKTIFLDDLIAQATIRGVLRDETEEIIEKLKRSGDLFEPKRGFIQKV